MLVTTTGMFVLTQGGWGCMLIAVKINAGKEHVSSGDLHISGCVLQHG